MPMTAEILKMALAKIAAKMEACAGELNNYDGKVGDGDLGITMSRGAREVMEQIDEMPADLGLAFLMAAQAFTKTSGSTFGTLIATGLMSVAKATRGREEAAWSEVSGFAGAAVEAMSARGKARLGDKTVLDALDAIRAATEDLDDPAAIATAASRAVDETLEAFRDQPSKVGRARIFADKSIGLDDPGMMALRRIVDALQ